MSAAPDPDRRPDPDSPPDSDRRPDPEAADDLEALEKRVTRCFACPRLVEWRERVAEEKRASFADEEYWGRPVPGFGDPEARMAVIGLAPAAHGANRTGRIFTGDRSGDWLFAALHRAGFADQPESVSRDDGLALDDAWVTASVRCAPPGNRPKPAERDTCRAFLERELELLRRADLWVCLGGYAWTNVLRMLVDRGYAMPSPRPGFGHGEEATIGWGEEAGGVGEGPAGTGGGGSVGPGGSVEEARSAEDPQPAFPGRERLTLLASYHPSQQNTFTGTLTEEMFDAVWERAREILGGG